MGEIDQILLSARQLRAARAAADWSYDTAAEKTGIGRATLYRAEHQVFKPEADTLERLIAAYAKEGIVFTEDGLRFTDGA
jgi:transcriptional regulator with XRE-family HTH domain